MYTATDRNEFRRCDPASSAARFDYSEDSSGASMIRGWMVVLSTANYGRGWRLQGAGRSQGTIRPHSGLGNDGSVSPSDFHGVCRLIDYLSTSRSYLEDGRANLHSSELVNRGSLRITLVHKNLQASIFSNRSQPAAEISEASSTSISTDCERRRG